MLVNNYQVHIGHTLVPLGVEISFCFGLFNSGISGPGLRQFLGPLNKRKNEQTLAFILAAKQPP